MCETAAMSAHLIRHGEVHNPDHVVYADLPGFVLSAKGREQARTVGRHLAGSPLERIVSSPLERARETSEFIAAATGATVEVDDRLLEWGLASHWAGIGWKRLPEVFPGELEAYLAHPEDLPFSPESLSQVANRIADCVTEWAPRTAGDTAFVSHEDPLHSARLVLTGKAPESYHHHKPAHCSVTTLVRSGRKWSMTGYWAPDQ